MQFPPIGTPVTVLQWAERQAEDDHLYWTGGPSVIVLATVTGVVTKYDGDYKSNSSETRGITSLNLNGFYDDYVSPELVNRKRVLLLAVRRTPESKEQLVWSWENP